MSPEKIIFCYTEPLELLLKLDDTKQNEKPTTDLSGLERWSKENQVATHVLLAEYHYIFSLEPGELGCTNIAKHKIRVVDDETFKEQF